MMGHSLLEVTGLVKRFGGLTATDGFKLALPPGELHALIGPNGAGKTTIINQIFGELSQDEGAIVLDGLPIGDLPVWRRVRLGIARTFQIAQLPQEYSALETLQLCVQAHAGHCFRFVRDARRDEESLNYATELLGYVGLSGREAVGVADLAQGERKQLELAAALASKPRLLLLDEPMAGLGPGESQRMVSLLSALKGKVAMLIVEHDMDAVFALADRISVLVYGRVIACGAADEIKANRHVREAYLGEGEAEC